MLARHGVEGEARADFGDTRRSFRDDDEIDRDENEEHDDSYHEITAHDEVGEAGDDVSRGVAALRAARQDQPCRGDIEREAQNCRDEQHGRESREFKRFLDPEGDHQDDDGQRD